MSARSLHNGLVWTLTQTLTRKRSDAMGDLYALSSGFSIGKFISACCLSENFPKAIGQAERFALPLEEP